MKGGKKKKHPLRSLVRPHPKLGPEAKVQSWRMTCLKVKYESLVKWVAFRFHTFQSRAPQKSLCPPEGAVRGSRSRPQGPAGRDVLGGQGLPDATPTSSTGSGDSLERNDRDGGGVSGSNAPIGHHGHAAPCQESERNSLGWGGGDGRSALSSG